MKVVTELAEALYQIGTIVHRNFNIDSLFVDDDFNIVVSDLGVAVNSNDFQGTQNYFDKKDAYMPPELYDDRIFSMPADQLGKMDVWGFAILACEVMSNALPWGDIEAEDIRNQLSNGKAPAIPELPELFKDLLKSCLNAEFKERPDKEEVASMVSRFYDEGVESNWTKWAVAVGEEEEQS